MTKHSLDEDSKKIVRAVLHSEDKRARRRRQGTSTEFDRRAAVAIAKAKKEIDLNGFEGEARRDMIQKIIMSLQYNMPWELMGEVLCCRRLFYEYRMEFCWHIAKNMGIVEDRSEDIPGKR